MGSRTAHTDETDAYSNKDNTAIRIMGSRTGHTDETDAYSNKDNGKQDWTHSPNSRFAYPIAVGPLLSLFNLKIHIFKSRLENLDIYIYIYSLLLMALKPHFGPVGVSLPCVYVGLLVCGVHRDSGCVLTMAV
jgi:hypothetical protein